MKFRFLVVLLIIIVVASFALAGCGSGEGEAPEAEAPAADSAAESDAEQEAPEANDEQSASDSLNPEFKELVDSYETFMDEYLEFFKDFDENDEKQMTAFNELMSRYYEISKEIDDWIEEGLSEADEKYLDEVFERVNEKQLEADIAMG